MQKLIIKDFGPIKDVNLDINDFMVFIGPQASGKSTISKLVYFFKLLKGEYWLFCMKITGNNGDKQKELNLGDFGRTIESLLLRIFEPHHLHIFEITYFYQSGIYIKLFATQEQQITCYFSDDFLKQHEKLVESLKETDDISGSFTGASPRDVQVRQRRRKISILLEKSLAELFNDSQSLTFIPAGRSFFSVQKNRTFFRDPSDLDYTVVAFAEEINSLRSLFDSYSTTEFLTPVDADIIPTIKIARELFSKIFKGAYSAQDDQDKINIGGDFDIQLRYASSGQQESLWILLALVEKIYYHYSSYICIEEPEAHLFTDAQNYITELIALFFNCAPNGVIITTHSPYILATINNLLHAFNVGQNHENKVNEIVDHHLWLDHKRLSAYFVENGTIRNILDEDLKMIKNEKIDTPASSIINSQYDKISEIEFQK